MGGHTHLEAQCDGEEEWREQAALANVTTHAKLGRQACVESDVTGQSSQQVSHKHGELDW